MLANSDTTAVDIDKSAFCVGLSVANTGRCWYAMLMFMSLLSLLVVVMSLYFALDTMKLFGVSLMTRKGDKRPSHESQNIVIFFHLPQ